MKISSQPKLELQNLFLSNKFDDYTSMLSERFAPGSKVLGGGSFVLDLNLKRIILRQSTMEFGTEPRFFTSRLMTNALPIDFFVDYELY